jgi:putative colanic acid biosynthesis glycosyltransferase
MKLLQVNSTVNTGSHGRIAEEIGQAAMQAGHISCIAFGRDSRTSYSETLKIGNLWDVKWHVLKSRLFDLHGFGTAQATRQFIEKIREFSPDIIHLHNIHGYFIHVEVLFNYLKTSGIPVVWTLHDCWAFTGHCAIFERVNCYRWQTQCFKCPNRHAYPESWWIDNSKRNYITKRRIFTGHNNLHLVVPSQWLADHVKNSFLGEYSVNMIHNGINLETFRIRDGTSARNRYGWGDYSIILGVAGTWKKRKALEDFIQLSRIIGHDERIVLVGLNRKQAATLAPGIIPVTHTESMEELSELYSIADVFVNPTYADNFPTTNIEALACGTPVITYNTGGSPETIDEQTGLVVEKGNIDALKNAVNKMLKTGKTHYSPLCRQRAEKLFDKNSRFADYLNLYDRILKQNNP